MDALVPKGAQAVEMRYDPRRGLSSASEFIGMVYQPPFRLRYPLFPE